MVSFVAGVDHLPPLISFYKKKKGDFTSTNDFKPLRGSCPGPFEAGSDTLNTATFSLFNLKKDSKWTQKINCACLQVKAVNLNFANNIPDIHRFDFQCRPSDLKYYYLCKLKKKEG